MTKFTSSLLSTLVGLEFVVLAPSEALLCVQEAQAVFCHETGVVQAADIQHQPIFCQADSSADQAARVRCCKTGPQRLCQPVRLTATDVMIAFERMQGKLIEYFSVFADHKMTVFAQLARAEWCLARALDASKVSFETEGDVQHWVWRTAKNLRLQHGRDLQAALLERAVQPSDDDDHVVDRFGYGDLPPNSCEVAMAASPEEIFLQCEWGHPDAKIRRAMRQLIESFNPIDVIDYCIAHREMWDGPVPHRLIQGKARALKRLARHLVELGIYDYEDLEAYVEELAGKLLAAIEAGGRAEGQGQKGGGAREA